MKWHKAKLCYSPSKGDKDFKPQYSFKLKRGSKSGQHDFGTQIRRGRLDCLHERKRLVCRCTKIINKLPDALKQARFKHIRIQETCLLENQNSILALL